MLVVVLCAKMGVDWLTLTFAMEKELILMMARISLVHNPHAHMPMGLSGGRGSVRGYV
jgi:hypothetical protein